MEKSFSSSSYRYYRVVREGTGFSFSVLEFRRDFHSPYPGRRKRTKKEEEEKKKESSNDKRMLPGVLSARRDAIRESFEKVAIIKRAVPSVVLQ